MNELHLQDLLNKIKNIETFAHDNGLNIHPTCRIKQAEQLINRFLSSNYNPPTDYEFPWKAYYEGIRDIAEISFICQMLSQDHLDDLKKHWNTLIKGANTPDQDSDSLARNIQFQLFFSAHFKKQGYPIEINEPDFLFNHHEKWYGVAAKRLSSANNLDKRVQEGVRQINESNYPGFVAISFDRIFQPNGGEKLASETIFSQSSAYPLLEETVNSYVSQITKRLKNSCLGFIGFLKILYYHESGLSLFIDSAEKWYPRSDADEELRTLIKEIAEK